MSLAGKTDLSAKPRFGILVTSTASEAQPDYGRRRHRESDLRVQGRKSWYVFHLGTLTLSGGAPGPSTQKPTWQTHRGAAGDRPETPKVRQEGPQGRPKRRRRAPRSTAVPPAAPASPRPRRALQFEPADNPCPRWQASPLMSMRRSSRVKAPPPAPPLPPPTTHNNPGCGAECR